MRKDVTQSSTGADESQTWISIDVGIKHLAYCCVRRVQCQPIGVPTLRILKWDVISFYDDIPLHSSSSMIPHHSSTTTTTTTTTTMTSAKKKKSTKLSLVEIGIQLRKWFDYLSLSSGIDGVLIENQIGPIASNMKSIQCMISQYFIMKDVPQIVFVSSTQKLKQHLTAVPPTNHMGDEIMGDEIDTPAKPAKPAKLTYKERKAYGIQMCRQLIQQSNGDWTAFYEKHKKKDDLADSYLQAFAYFS